MQEHTRKRPTKHVDVSELEREEEAISVEEFFKQSYGDFPKWAVCLSGLRNREGLTQKELGEKINVAQYHISRMERGLRPIGKKIAKRLANVFKIDYRLFL